MCPIAKKRLEVSHGTPGGRSIVWKFGIESVDQTLLKMVPFIRRLPCLHEARACNIKMTARLD